MMMRSVGVGVIIMLIFCTTVFGEAIPPEPGTLSVFTSRNNSYTVTIQILGYPDDSPSMCTLSKSGEILWSKRIPTTPSRVAISDNGECIAMTNWGWYDEGGSRSLSIYNRDGDLVKEIDFGNPEMGSQPMKWIRVLAVSPDGNYCIMGVNTREHALFSLVDCQAGRMVWEKEFGLSEASEAKLANQGSHILIATRDYYSRDMEFLLLNHQGTVLYRRSIAQNFSWDVADYLRLGDDEKTFEIYDVKLNQYCIEKIY